MFRVLLGAPDEKEALQENRLGGKVIVFPAKTNVSLSLT
jgi:hypothetical protein